MSDFLISLIEIFIPQIQTSLNLKNILKELKLKLRTIQKN